MSVKFDTFYEKLYREIMHFFRELSWSVPVSQ